MVKDIKAVALDVDGVLTDGTFIWGTNGEEFKKFSFMDVMGISLASKAGIVFALISGEDNILVDRFAEKMKIDHVFKGIKDKASALGSFAEINKLAMEQICFMGDDVNDLGALKLAGYSAAPANAHESVKRTVDLVTNKAGGNGAVRELLDGILAKKTSGKS
ncbi:MAG TPA: HAD hydrolase family protein [Smithella sp.]|nr:HAD hydrolase family protein [Smithella sp.]HOQ42316.1 HAD hydrolase family protein [Smithellaceae bacterium]HPH55804.1 HAD hydrolase family protein [Smithella sp.]HPL68409.1 HAD hydrolase family protein [Smithellaceae bacterium]HPN87623.1 HAD hydrolase family protein [Smithella sp.]